MLHVYRAHNSWWIYPIVGQLLGGVLGGLAYELTIAIHHEVEEEVSMVETANEDVESKPLLEDGETAAGSKGSSPRTN